MAELYDVIVIGGGISGLTTAYHLRKRDRNLRVVVLEAKGLINLVVLPLFLFVYLALRFIRSSKHVINDHIHK